MENKKTRKKGKQISSSEGITDIIDVNEIRKYFSEIGIETEEDNAKRAAVVLQGLLMNDAKKYIKKAINQTKVRKLCFGPAAMIISAKE